MANISGLSEGAVVTYDGKTYSHTITLPSDVTATCDDTLTIDGKTYYADGSTVEISNFGEGKEITFDATISLEVSGENILAKVDGTTVLTLSGLSLYSEDKEFWKTNGDSASYGTDIHKGAKIDSAKIIYQPDTFEETLKLENLADNVTAENLNAAVKIEGTEIIFTADTVLDSSKVVTAPTGYTLKIGGTITQSEEKTEKGTMEDDTFSYISAGNTTGYRVVGDTIKYFTDERKTFTISGLNTVAELGKNISVNGDKITISKNALAQGNATLTTSDNFTMEFDGVSAATLIGENWSGLNYQSEYYSAEGWEIDSNNINYTGTTTPKNLFSLSGVESNTGFTVSKNNTAYTVKVADSAVANLTEETTVTLANVDSNITANFAFAENFSGKKTLTENAATLSGGKYTSKTYNAYTEIDGANLTFHPATTAKEFTITNLSDAAKLGENVIVTDDDTTNFKFYSTALDKKSVEISGGTFTVELDSTVDQTAETIEEVISVTNGTLNYVSAGKGECYTATEAGVEYTAQTGCDAFTLSGLKNTAAVVDGKVEGVEISGNTVKVTDAAFDMTAETGYTVKFENIDDADFVLDFKANTNNTEVAAKATQVNATTVDYVSAYTPAHFTGSSNSFNFVPEDGKDTFTITGIGITSMGYTLEGGAINSWFTVSDDKVVTLTASTVPQGVVSITGNYTLALPSSINQTDGVLDKDVTLIKSGTEFKYYSKTYKAWYEVSDDEKTVTYHGGAGSEQLMRFIGLNITADEVTGTDINTYFTVSDSNKTVTLTEAAMTADHQSIYFGPADQSLTLVIPQNYSKTNIPFAQNGNKVTLAGTTAGYELEGSTYVWQTQFGGEEIEITGLKSGLTLTENNFVRSNGKITFKLTDAMLPENPTEISISSTNATNYALDYSALSTTAATNAHWDGFNYVAGKTASSWSASNNNQKITYTAAKGGEILTTISGVKNTDGLSISGNVVTVANSSLDGNNVSISNGYTLALAEDVPIPKSNELWEIVGGTATYKKGGRSAGYLLTENKIIYSEVIENTNFVTVKGLKNTATAKNILLDGTNVSVSASAVNKGEVTISDGFSLTLGTGTYKNISVVGGEFSDTITQNGNSAVITTGADDDIISLGNGTSKNTIIGGIGDDSIFSTKGKNYYSYAEGDGDDVISGFTANDTLKITSGEIENWYVEDGDLIFKIGDGSIKILDGADLSITITDANNVTKIYNANTFYDSKKKSVTLNSNIQETYTEKISSVISINGAAADSVEIIGNAKNNSILGGKGNDTLNGSTGNDTLTGGNGSDVFIYNAGRNFITDYNEEDKLLIDSSFTPSVYGNDVVLKVGFNKLTVKDALGKKISVNDDVRIYELGKIYSEDKTELTLTSVFKGTVENGVENIFGANFSSNILGNNSDNLIVGGRKADTLNGGNGNDTLTGGDGRDIFVFESGDDVISDYAEYDKISLNAEITNSYTNENDVIFETKNGSVKILNGAGKKITTLDAQNNTNVQIYYDGCILNKRQTAVTLTSYFSESTYTATNTLVTIDSSATDSVEIIGNSKNNSILGGSGNDTLWGNAGKDTLFGGDGADIFIYNAGKDFIADYNEEDKISIDAAEITASVKGNDVIFNKNLTVKNALGKKISVNDDVRIYELGKIYSEDKTELTLTSAFKGTVENGVENIFGANFSSNILGNNSDNLIVGGRKADTLNGGNGNDTLTGGNGNDLFVYENGNDVITDYTAGQDKIKISGNISNYYFDGADVIFNTSEGSITVQNAKDKKITLLDSNNKISYWFDGNPNFIKAENQISSLMKIADTNYSVGNIFNDNVTEISNDKQPNITFEK